MSSIFSSISGYFSKSLILGTFFPVAVFVTMFYFFVVPLFPVEGFLAQQIEALNSQWQLLPTLLFTVVLSGWLYNINTPIIRFFEGYPWKDSWIGRYRTQHYREELLAIERRRKGMRTLLRYLGRTIGDKDPIYKEILQEWSRLGLQINNAFPTASLILPTRLGNVMRSFEYYPSRQYGIDSITIWPRLIAYIDKDYAIAIDDVKSSFDFMLNSSVLSAVLAGATLFVGLLYPGFTDASHSWRLLTGWIVQILAFSGLAYLFYLGAINRTAARGALVKGAFDLYRWKLLEQLGYKHTVTNAEEERKLWRLISEQMIYGDAPTGVRVNYILPVEPVPPSVRSSSPTAKLELTRGVRVFTPGKPVEVVLRVKNSGDKEAAQIVVFDTLPAEYEYCWGSAQLEGRPVDVIGTSHYQFRIDKLLPGQETTVTYQMLPRPDVKETVLKLGR